MKKKLITLCTAAVAIVSGYGSMNAYKTVENNNLLVENVEALSKGEGFNGSFNGQDWDTDEHFYNKVGTDWCPVLLPCTVTSGSWNVSVGVGGENFHGDISYNSGTSTYPGHCISCHSGKGNCVNGTNCVRD